MVKTSWRELDGRAVKEGFDPLDLPIDRLLNWVYLCLMENSDEKERNKMEIELNRPLPGENPTDGVWSDAAMSDAFMSLAGDMGTEV